MATTAHEKWTSFDDPSIVCNGNAKCVNISDAHRGRMLEFGEIMVRAPPHDRFILLIIEFSLLNVCDCTGYNGKYEVFHEDVSVVDGFGDGNGTGVSGER